MGHDGAPRISVVINTLNEAANIGNAIRSVSPWADEVVVVDMESDDETQEIARSLGARVFSHERLGYADPARAFAVSRSTGDWVVIIDADEMIPIELGTELRRLAAAGTHEVVEAHWLNYLFGREMRGGGYGLGEAVRTLMFRRSAVELTPEIHNFMRIGSSSRIHTLPSRRELAVIHFNYRSVEQYIERLNRYTRVEAATRHGPRTGAQMLAWVVREMVARYIRRRGYRDGWRGIFVAGAMAFYRLAAWAKRQEEMELGAVATADIYGDIAAAVLDAYASRTDLGPSSSRRFG